MAKSRRNGMLGVGGQRSNLSRRALRGGKAPAPGSGGDPAAEKRELLRKMRERNERHTTPERDATPKQGPAPESGTASE
ncbi:DUF6243 family protein [Spirillospora sp. NPDC048819]|uniref:DUF6243 family protein n=1 Tax=Spirillospora sp. NPDC048819 TaxID=3155268 RepID=UPI00340C6238